VLFPVGAYFGVVVIFISAIIAGKSRPVLTELTADSTFLAVLFSFVLSCLYSRDRLLSFGGLVMLGLNAGLYLVLVAELKKNGFERYYRILNIGCSIACIYGLYQFTSGNLLMPESWVDEKNFGSLVRIYSTLLNPNIFAAYLAMNLSLGLSRYVSLKKDILLSVNIVLSSVCLLLTYSRGGFAAFFAAMLVLCILKERKKGIFTYMSFMTAAFIFMNTAGNASRIGLAAVYKDSSSLYRLEIWRSALKMFMENPIFGHGPGTTWYYLSSGSEKLYSYILHSHNIYLQVAAEMGITGLIAFSYLLMKKIYDGTRLLREKIPEADKIMIQGFMACIAGIAVHGLIDAVIFVPAFSLIFMGYTAIYGKILSEHVMELSRGVSLKGKGFLKLFGSKGSGKEKYKEEEGKTCEA
jgi:putative inorganic carbon (HCO3(-)) transporter